jgi:RNA polymerase sigma-70 factor (ECF subfamily)
MDAGGELQDDSPAAAQEAHLHRLIRAAAAGNDAAYRDFLSALSSRLRAYLRRRLAGRPDELEDLLQETLLAIHNQRHTYDPAQPLTPWVHAIARYKLIDFLRRHSRSATDAGPDTEDDLLDPAGGGQEPEMARRDLDRLLAALPARQRDAIRLLKVEGHSVAETSHLTGMSESAVKVSVHRGLRALARRLREEP